MEVAPPVGPFKNVMEKSGDVMNVQARVVLTCSYEQVFRQGELPLTEDGIGNGKDFLWLSPFLVGGISLGADRQKERMNPGSINGVNGMYTGNKCRDQGTGQFMNEGAKSSIFLWRTTDGSKGPDRPFPVKALLHPDHWKVVGKAVISQVVAERSFREGSPRIDDAAYAEIGLGRDRQLSGPADQFPASPSQKPREGKFRHTLRQKHDGCYGEGRRPADEDIYPERDSQRHGLGMMDTDSAMNLIMQSNLL